MADSAVYDLPFRTTSISECAHDSYTQMCNVNNTIDCFDAQPLPCASELHPEHIHVACQGCFGTAWGLKDTHRLIRYPVAFGKGAPANTFQNYRVFEMLSLSVAVLILSPTPSLFSRMVASKDDTVGIGVPFSLSSHIRAVVLNLSRHWRVFCGRRSSSLTCRWHSQLGCCATSAFCTELFGLGTTGRSSFRWGLPLRSYPRSAAWSPT